LFYFCSYYGLRKLESGVKHGNKPKFSLGFQSIIIRVYKEKFNLVVYFTFCAAGIKTKGSWNIRRNIKLKGKSVLTLSKGLII